MPGYDRGGFRGGFRGAINLEREQSMSSSDLETGRGERIARVQHAVCPLGLSRVRRLMIPSENVEPALFSCHEYYESHVRYFIADFS